MQRIKRFNAFHQVKPDQVVTFPGEKMRTVRIEVRAPERTKLFVKSGAKGAKAWLFLALVEGNDVIEVGWHGPLLMKADQAIAVWSSEMENTLIEVDKGEVLTKPLLRRPRNKEMERMMFEMQRNIEGRMSKQLEEIEKRYGTAVRKEVARDERKHRRHIHVDSAGERVDLKASDPSDDEAQSDQGADQDTGADDKESPGTAKVDTAAE